MIKSFFLIFTGRVKTPFAIIIERKKTSTFLSGGGVSIFLSFVDYFWLLGQPEMLSLRRYYPDQVRGSRVISLLSAQVNWAPRAR
jgi:hypothetical protein